MGEEPPKQFDRGKNPERPGFSGEGVASEKERRVGSAKEFSREARSISEAIEKIAPQIDFSRWEAEQIGLARKLAKEVVEDAVDGKENEAREKMERLRALKEKLEAQTDEKVIHKLEAAALFETGTNLGILRTRINKIILDIDDYDLIRRVANLNDSLVADFDKLRDAFDEKRSLSLDERKVLKEISADVNKLLNMGTDGLKNYLEAVGSGDLE